MNLKVLYEDNHILAVFKPGGMLTQPSGTEQDSVEAQAKAWIKQKYQKPGNVFLHAVHRLDKPVSGIVLFARTSKALSRLQESMREKRSRKGYLAVVEGEMPAKEGVLEHYLTHDDFKASISTESNPEAKLARLQYRLLKSQGSVFALIEIQLETGRYHQIRVQCAAVGCPIIGDLKYGSKHRLEEGVIALHHSRLEIQHPITQEWLVINAEVPDYWPMD